MTRLFLFISLILIFSEAAGQQNFQYYYGQAREAFKSGDHAKFYDMIGKANELHPYHQGALYYRGVAAALNNRPDEAVNYLRDAVLVNAQFDLSIEELKSLSNQKDFEALKSLQQNLRLPIVHSDTAFI